MQLLFLLFSSYFASLFCLYLNTRYADLKVPFDMMGHILFIYLFFFFEFLHKISGKNAQVDFFFFFK